MRLGSVLVLSLLATTLACAEEDPQGGGGGGGGDGGFPGAGGGGGGGSGGEGGSGGDGSAGSGGSGSPCGINPLEAGDAITLNVTGSDPFSGQMTQVPGLSGCRLGVTSDNRDGFIGYADATSRYKLDFNWKLALDPAWDGNTNADLVGKTLTPVKKGAEWSLTVWFDHTTGKNKYYGKPGAITIEELDDAHVKGCLHSFTSWKTLDGAKSVTVEQPIRFNCEL